MLLLPRKTVCKNQHQTLIQTCSLVTTPQVTAMANEKDTDWTRFMADVQARVADDAGLETRGTLTRLTGLVLEATGIKAPVGSQCLVQMPGHDPVLSEVVGFSADKAFLMPAGDIHGLSSGASVVPAPPYVPVPRLGEPAQPISRSGALRLPLGDGLLGRVVDAQGVPLDHGGPLTDVTAEPMDRSSWATASLTWPIPTVCSAVETLISRIMLVTRCTSCTICCMLVPAVSTNLLPASTLSTLSLISSLISLAASALRPAKLRTSLATTAKPRPCSPARAASTAALSAKMLV